MNQLATSAVYFVVVRNDTTLYKARGSTSTMAWAFISCSQRNCVQLCLEPHWTSPCARTDYASPAENRHPRIAVGHLTDVDDLLYSVIMLSLKYVTGW